VPFGDKKRRKEQCKTYKGFFLKKNGPNNPYFEVEKKNQIFIFRQQVPAYLEHRLEPIAKFG